MDSEILDKLVQLKLHVDKRLDEIYSMIKAHSTKPVPSIQQNGDSHHFPQLANMSPVKTTPTYNERATFTKESLTSQFDPIKTVNVATSPTNFARTAYPMDISSPLRSITPEFGKYLDVQLSYVYSTRSFYVHLNYDDVERFYENLNDYYLKRCFDNDVLLPPHAVSLKQLCCILNAEDASYYRAQVLKESEGKYLVRLIDFGDMKLIEPKSMFKLIPEFAKIPIFALHCYLDDSWTEHFETLETVFMEFLSIDNAYCSGTKACFNPQPSKDLNKFPVSLMILNGDGKWQDLRECIFANVPIAECVSRYIFNFKEFARNYLMASNFSKSSEAYERFNNAFKSPQPIAEQYSVFCTNSADINNFIVAQNSVIEFTSNLSFFYRGFLEYLVSDIKVNSIVVFGIENKFFFRGFVLSAGVSSMEIFSIDFGFVMTIKDCHDIFPLFDLFSLQQFAPYSMLCTLHNCVSVLDTWSPVALKTFQTFVNGTFTIYPKSQSKGKHSVEVEMGHNSRASDMLKKFKLARDNYY